MSPMAHLAKKKINEYSWLVRCIFRAQKWKYGSVLEPAWLWGYSTPLLLAMQVYYRLLDRKRNPLSRELRALISHRISQLNHCEFCSDLSASSLEKLGISMEKFSEISNFSQSHLFTSKEKAALQWAELMTVERKIPKAQEFSPLKEFFSDQEIVELTAWISFQILSSKFNAALDVSPQGFCHLPGKKQP